MPSSWLLCNVYYCIDANTAVAATYTVYSTKVIIDVAIAIVGYDIDVNTAVEVAVLPSLAFWTQSEFRGQHTIAAMMIIIETFDIEATAFTICAMLFTVTTCTLV